MSVRVPTPEVADTRQPATTAMGEPRREVSQARRAAFMALLRVETDDAWSNEALDAAFARLPPSSAPDQRDADRRLATEIVMGVLRWRAKLDAQISEHTGRDLASLDPAVRTSLRMGLYQVTFLTRTPPFAVVHDAVELVKQSSETTHAAGFVNAILREILRQRGVNEEKLAPVRRILKKPTPPPVPSKRVRRKSVTPSLPPRAEAATIADRETELSHPAWLLHHWARALGETRATCIALANNAPPPTFIWLNPLRESPTATRMALEAAGLTLQPVAGLATSYEVTGGNLAALGPFITNGTVYVQDAGSQHVTRWLGVQPGQRVLDMCAAPGGKTAQLAALMQNQGGITALDVHPHRVAAMEQNLARLGVKIARCYVADATSSQLISTADHRRSRKKLPFSLFPDSFDAVLLDAPCSGTGTLRRHPEIKWRLTLRKLAEFAGLQTKLLWNAAQVVKPGGTLLYAVCSLEAREGEEVLRTFLKHHRHFEVAPPSDAGSALTGEGFLRLWPDQDNTDGFFAARLRRAQ
ncbi:MAG: transcription antitermination factor NusB [Chloracidobacterium sp.]|uniref:Methyltransferase domain-containing protein n=1 Tax=Chloracidobacterium validum TaxID=2821543 RepID=A0ABX8BD85_9BACT|nr:transcription antitermination factor NusB [Chloracidobacterium validum]QUW04654.1 methyltransferase domain-containing protein [Chloracidobacterium validum]